MAFSDRHFLNKTCARLCQLSDLRPYDEELAVFEQALDGDQNGDFQGLSDKDDPNKSVAIVELLKHLDEKLTGSKLPSAYHDVIKEHLLTVNWNNTKNVSEALAIIRDAVMLIVTSSQYMIQK